MSIGAGEDYVGKPKDFGEKVAEDYTAHRYHQPADAYSPDFDLSGAAQISNIVLKLRAHARELAGHADVERGRRVQGGAREVAEAGVVGL